MVTTPFMKKGVILLLVVLYVALCGWLSISPSSGPLKVITTLTHEDPQTLTANESVPDLTGRLTGLTEGHIQGSGFFPHPKRIYIIS